MKNHWIERMRLKCVAAVSSELSQAINLLGARRITASSARSTLGIVKLYCDQEDLSDEAIDQLIKELEALLNE